ncbi:hypothetical protein CGL27_11320 [Streptomyces sp. 11-1-2]|nr:hypothetical protein CGL27_11320 [Streptomyces sp. 11-1-2]
MRQEWSPEELLASWTLVDGDWDLVANKTGATRLGFSLLLKFFELEGPELFAQLSGSPLIRIIAGLGRARGGRGPGEVARQREIASPRRRRATLAPPISAAVSAREVTPRA